MERNQELFNYLNETFDIVALESELDEIVNIIEKKQNENNKSN